MGIDIYVRWEGQTEAEKKAQYTGFSTEAGNIGYLRESYHGGPYATRFLVAEAFAADDDPAIPAKILQARLPATVMLAIYRDHIVYGEAFTEPGVIDIEDNGTESPLSLIGHLSQLFGPNGTITKMKTGADEENLANSITEEQRKGIELLIQKRSLPESALSFVDFVDLCVKKEAETGKPCTIVASY